MISRFSPLTSTVVGVLAGGALVLAATTPRAATGDVPTIAVDQVKPGMKGYGLTVFSGTEPEKFDVEVIDVLHKFRPNQDLVLVKTIHPRLAKVNVVAGMSGSPVFLNDGGTAKLLGAYAYGWSFGNEPVAGVTPIGNMLAEVNRPLLPSLLSPKGKPPLGPKPTPGQTGAKTKTGSIDAAVDDTRSATRWSGAPGTYSLAAHVKEVAARLGPKSANGMAPSMVETPLIVGGMSDRAIAELTTMLSPLGLVPLQGGGAGVAKVAKGAPEHFVDGGAIAVQLMRGDSAAQATGTVTHVIGKRLVGFGHPMMEVGSSQFPTAVAKILWVLSSDQRSFKIGEPVRDLGTLIQDREPCIVVDEDIVPPMIPMTIDIEGDPTAPKKKWAMEVGADKFMAPMWTAFAFADAVTETLNDKKDASWVLTASIKIKDHGTITLDDFGVSGSGVPQTAFMLSRPGFAVGELMNNPWEPGVTIEKIDAKLVVDFKRDAVRLRSAVLLDDPVDAGQSARVKLTMKPYFGEEYSVIGSIPIDRTLAGKDVEIEVVPGWTVYPDAAAPESVDQLLHNLALSPMSPKSFVLQYKTAQTGLAMKGKVAAKLPGFAVDALKATSSTEVPEAFQPMVRSAVDVGSYVDGTTRLHLTVRTPVQ
ncbi:MAG: hypothetical protein NVS3B10_06960 [Polyangiales bacterium]